jgi:hypothetical protein
VSEDRDILGPRYLSDSERQRRIDAERREQMAYAEIQRMKSEIARLRAAVEAHECSWHEGEKDNARDRALYAALKKKRRDK